jgi:hypothetical protein
VTAPDTVVFASLDVDALALHHRQLQEHHAVKERRFREAQEASVRLREEAEEPIPLDEVLRSTPWEVTRAKRDAAAAYRMAVLEFEHEGAAAALVTANAELDLGLPFHLSAVAWPAPDMVTCLACGEPAANCDCTGGPVLDAYCTCYEPGYGHEPGCPRHGSERS